MCHSLLCSKIHVSFYYCDMHFLPFMHTSFLFLLVLTGIITILLPCYTAGKNAEAVGQNCMAHAIYTIIPIVNIYFSATTRGKIRELKSIEVYEVNHSISYRDAWMLRSPVDITTMILKWYKLSLEYYLIARWLLRYYLHTTTNSNFSRSVVYIA